MTLGGRSAVATTKRMTFADLLTQQADGCHDELVRGEIRRMPLPKTRHGHIEALLAGAVDRYLYARAVALGWSDDDGATERDRPVCASACLMIPTRCAALICSALPRAGGPPCGGAGR